MNGYEIAFEIKRVRPELIVIMVSSSEVPVQALTMVDAFVPKLETSRELLPMIAELCKRTDNPRQEGDVSSDVNQDSPRPSPGQRFEYGRRNVESPRGWEEDS
jgi:hypothetical protein